MKKARYEMRYELQEHLYMVSYDFSEDKLRTKIAKLLEGYGRRVQYSVFFCHLNRTRYRELYQKILQLCEGHEEGSVLFLSICAKCEEKKQVIGEQMNAISEEKEDIIIV